MKRLFYLISPLVVVVVWELVSRNGLVSPVLFPAPSKVAVALWLMIQRGVFFWDVCDSLWRVLLGFFIGSTAGVFIGLLTGRSNFFKIIFSPLISILRPLPPVAIIPLVIVWFGIGDGAKIFSIAFAVFFLVWVNSHIGFHQVSVIFIWDTRLLTHSWFKKIFRVLVPASMPFIVAGLRIAIAISFIMLFVSELAGASGGVGYRISVSHLSYRIDQMMAGLLVLGALGAISDQLFVWLTSRIFPWLKLSSK